MNSKIKTRPVFPLLVAVMVIVSACGTLQIETEPGASLVEPAATLTQATEPTPSQVVVETDVVTTASEEETTSAEIIEATDGSSGELLTYTNPEYGFALSYPPAWSLAEVNDEDFVGPGSRSVQLSQRTVKLVIGYRQSGENVAISGSGAPGGEFDVRGTVQVFGQDVERYVIVYEGKDKVVMYGEPGPPPISAGGLEFGLRLDDFNPDYENVELSQSVQDEADMIVSSLAIIGEEGGSGVQDTGISEITALDETWSNYTNYQLGFSINFPNMKSHFFGSCVWNEANGDHSYRPDPALVPVRIFEDGDTVYITSEYQYELTGETREENRSFFSDCQKVMNSLELLRDPEYYQEKWEIVAKEVSNDEELDGFIKSRFGEGCSLGEKVASGQDGVYDVSILGDGKDLAETLCPLNYGTVVKVYPEANKVVAWDTGQAYTFAADVANAVTYDQEMIDSFRFLTEVSPKEAVGSNDYDYSDWQLYTNDASGYSLMVPAVAEIVSPDPGQRVAFIGPEVDNKPQFQFMVEHYDSNLSEGTDFRQSLAEGHHTFLDSLGISAAGMVEEVTIAGLTAIQLRIPAINESDARDDFHFMNEDTMFRISITHTGDSADWALYDQFLKSITFEYD